MRTHAVMVSCLHAAMLTYLDTSRRTTRGRQPRTTGGQEEGNKKNTTGGHRVHRRPTQADTGRRRTRGQEEEEDKDNVWRPAEDAHQKKDKKRTTGGQRPDTAFTHAQRLWPASLFLRENPNSKLFGETLVQKAMGRLEQQTSAPFGERPIPKLLIFIISCDIDN